LFERCADASAYAGKPKWGQRRPFCPLRAKVVSDPGGWKRRRRRSRDERIDERVHAEMLRRAAGVERPGDVARGEIDHPRGEIA
jgi:hypothetical protein